MEILTSSAEDTSKLGEKIGADIVNGKSPRVLALVGDLGSGKTTFVQGLAKFLGVIGPVISPTFIIVREYDLKKGTFYHIDLYRFEGNVDQELQNIGFDEMIKDPNNVVVIEWAEKGKKIMPQDALWINFEYSGEGRKITIND